jgi:uncharacterized repeat protein (TIGR01451 family)
MGESLQEERWAMYGTQVRGGCPERLRARLRRLALILAAFAWMLGPVPLSAQVGPSTMEVIPRGSLIIAMDNDKQNIGAEFNLSAYGLAIRLLHADIPVKWAINDFKAKDGNDFTGRVKRIAPTAADTAGVTLNFAGGPFVVHVAYADSAKKVLTAFGRNVAVYELMQETTLPIRYTLLHKPRAFVNSTSRSIHESVLIAAGLSTPQHWTHGPDIGLQNTSCYTIVLEPHNTTTTGVAAIQAFLESGGNFLGQCASVVAFENVARWLTTNGIVVANVSNALSYPSPAQPFSQFVGLLAAAPGGSVEDWILAAGSGYRPGVHHHAVSHPSSGTRWAASVGDVFAGPGGNVFYLGGHDYNRSSIDELNGRRMLLNALMTPATRPGICNILPLTVPIPDLALSKTSPSSFIGPEGTYTLTVANLGTAATPDTVVVTDTLPSGLLFRSGAGAGWTFSVDGTQRIVTARYPASLAPGGTTSFTLTVDVTVAAAGTVTNRARVAEQSEINLANNVATATTDVPAITGLVFEDFNANGVRDPDEVGLPGIRVEVTSGGVTVTGVTGPDGVWIVVGVPPGPAVVDVVDADLPAGAYHTSAGEDPNDITAPSSGILDAGIDGYAGLRANLSVVKTGPATALVSDTVTYLITTTNLGPAVARLVVVRDTLHTGTTYLGGSRSPVLAGNALTWSPIELSVGGSVVDTVRVRMPATAKLPANLDTIPNIARAAGIREDPDLSNNRSVVLTVLTQPDLAIAKSHTGDFTVNGTGTYTITVANNGTGTALPATVVTDTLPDGLTFVSGAGIIGDWSIQNDGQVVVATLPSELAAGASASFALTVSLGPSAAPSVTNVARVSGQREANTANNSASDLTLVRTADLTVTKTSTPFAQGVNGTYTVTVRNVGDGATSDVITVVDDLPPGLTYVAGAGVTGNWSVTADGQVVTATTPGPIAPGDSARFTITVLPGPSAAPSVTNTVNVSGGGDGNTANNSGSVTTSVTGVPDLTVAKAAGSFTYGSPGTYTVTVTNIGGAPTTAGFVVTDTLPAGLTFVSGSGTGWTLVPSAGGTVVTATYSGPPLAALNGSSSFTMTISVLSTAPSVTNTVRVQGGGETNETNNVGTVSTAVTPRQDLAITKTAPAGMVQGLNAVYTITVTNAGAAASSLLVTVTDTLPASLTWVATGAWTGAPGTTTLARTGQVVTGTFSGSLAPGASASFTITVTPTLAAAQAGSVTNVARVANASDTNPSNNLASVTTPVAATGTPPDLVVSKTSSAFSLGRPDATYTLTVRNVGATSTTGQITVADTLPAGVSYVTGVGTGWTLTSAPAAAPFEGRTVVTATRTLAIAANTDAPVITLTVGIAVDAAPSLTNTAWVSGGGESNTGNNSGSVTTPVLRGDLTVAKTSGAFTYGANGTYTITVGNAGPGVSHGLVTVRDTLPAGLTYVSAAGTGWSASAVLQEGRWIVTATSSQVVAAGTSFNALTITATVTSAAVKPVTNTVHVSGGNETNTSNNSASVTTAIAGADLAITKTASVGQFVPGQPASYTIAIQALATGVNVSGSSGSPIVVTDTLPLGIVPTATTAVVGTWVFTPAASLDPVSGRWVVRAERRSNLNSGSSASFTIAVDVLPTAAPSAYNKAYASASNNNNPANDTSSVTTPVASPDLTVVKSAVGTFFVGGNASYRIVVRNVGTSATFGTVTMTDGLPAGLTYRPTGTAGDGWTFSASGQTVTGTFAGTILPGDSSVITLGVTVGPEAAGTVQNTATVSGGGDVVPGNNSSTVTTPVGAQSDLIVSKSSGTFTYGTNGTYTLQVTNTGTIATSGTVTVRDTLPAGLTFVSGSGPGWTVVDSDGVVTATTPGPIAAGSSSSFTFQVDVGPEAVPSVYNRARVSGGGQLNTTNDTTSFTTTVLAPDLTILKTSGPLEALEDATYTIKVTNVGTSPTTTPIVVTDTLPLGLSFVSGSGSGWTVLADGQEVTGTYAGLLGAGQSASFILAARVEAAAGEVVTNVAHVSGGGEVNTGNNTDDTYATVGGKPDLTIAKALDGPLVKGLDGSYTVTVTNSGNATTTAPVVVMDVLPGGLTYTSATGAGWTFGVSGQTVTATRTDPLDAGETASFVLNVSVQAGAGTQITNVATVSGGGEENDTNNGSGPVDATVIAPDLVVTKTAGALFTGVATTYEFTVSNVGDASTFGTVIVSDTVPTGLQYLDATGTGWTFNYAPADRILTASYTGILNPGATSGFSARFTVTAGADQTVVNRAVVSGGGDGDTGNNVGVSQATVGGMPDLTILKIANGIFGPGYPASYTLTVVNSGSATTTEAIVVTDVLPAQLEFMSAEGTGWSIVAVGETVTATYDGSLGAGQTASFTLEVLVQAPNGTDIVNTATVAGGGEVEENNNSATATVTVIGQPGITLTKVVSPEQYVRPGEELTYTITFENVGSADAYEIVVTDHLPQHILLHLGSIQITVPGGIPVALDYFADDEWSPAPPAGGCSAPAGYDACVSRLRWSLEQPLAPGGRGTIVFVVKVR